MQRVPIWHWPFFLNARLIEIRSFRCTRYFSQRQRSYCLALERNGSHEEVRSIARFVFGRPKNEDCLAGKRYFIDCRVARVIARRAQRSSDTCTLYFFLSFSLLDSFRVRSSNNTLTIGDPLLKTLRYTEAVARTRARPLVARRSPFVSTQFWKILNDN